MALLGHINRKQSIAIVLGILVLFFVGGIYLVQRQSGKYQIASTTAPLPPEQVVVAQPTTISVPSASATPSSGVTSGFLLNEFHRSQIKDGRTVWEVRGSKGQYFPTENKAIIHDARLVLSRTPEEHVTVEAGQATLFLNGSELVRADVIQDVKLNYKDEVQINTDHAMFDQTSNIVTAPGLVTITQEIVDVSGENLEANLNTQEFNLKQNVVTVVKPRSQK